MDDEQLAARRAEIPVHCAACGGEYPGTTVLHNGICDECRKLTHGPNYRMVAALNAKDDEIAAALHRVAALRNHLDTIAQTWTGKASRQAECAIVEDDVQAERDRIRFEEADHA